MKEFQSISEKEKEYNKNRIHPFMPKEMQNDIMNEE